MAIEGWLIIGGSASGIWSLRADLTGPLTHLAPLPPTTPVGPGEYKVVMGMAEFVLSAPYLFMTVAELTDAGGNSTIVNNIHRWTNSGGYSTVALASQFTSHAGVGPGNGLAVTADGVVWAGANHLWPLPWQGTNSALTPEPNGVQTLYHMDFCDGVMGTTPVGGHLSFAPTGQSYAPAFVGGMGGVGNSVHINFTDIPSAAPLHPQDQLGNDLTMHSFDVRLERRTGCAEIYATSLWSHHVSPYQTVVSEHSIRNAVSGAPTIEHGRSWRVANQARGVARSAERIFVVTTHQVVLYSIDPDANPAVDPPGEFDLASNGFALPTDPQTPDMPTSVRWITDDEYDVLTA